MTNKSNTPIPGKTKKYFLFNRQGTYPVILTDEQISIYELGKHFTTSRNRINQIFEPKQEKKKNE